MGDDLQLFLEKRLKRTLPGRKAQLKMVPNPINQQAKPRNMEPPSKANYSSVLLLFFPNKIDKLSLIFTVRSNEINHGGQISFPGGRAEKGESPQGTALREANEEIGINPVDVNIVGNMSDLFVNVSNNVVTPVVGFIDYKPNFKLNAAEVDEVFTVPLSNLSNEKNKITEKWELRSGAFYDIPFWNVHDVPLWGATAMILSEFMELYMEFKSQI